MIRPGRALPALVAALLACPVVSGAAADPPASPPSLRAVRLATPPLLDGEVLGDHAWNGVEPVTEFWQTMPREGQPASERTEVRVGFTDTALYVAVICYDRTPAEIIVADARRDSPLDQTDSFRLIVDTYLDRQNGFVFGTSPAGLEYDGQVINEGYGTGFGFGGGNQQGGSGGGFNLNWDGAWRVRTATGAHGWSAEFEIPFRTLRYPASDAQTWGINFQRTIRRRNETAYWAPLPRQFDLFRLSLAGTLEGLQIPSQRNLKVVPYALGRMQAESGGTGASVLRGDVGLDLKYSLTPSVTLDATLNTDFAQVEVDEQQINLDRFNLFFPEKRPFFLENAGLFAVGSPGEVEVFFSRRIGIGPAGAPVPIVGGARLSGQVGNGLNVGLLNMQTDDVPGLTAANNFTVGRIRQDLPNRSSVGVIVVNRQPTGVGAAESHHNRTLALDARVGIGRTGLLSGFAAATSTPGLSGDAHAFQVMARRETEQWLLNAGFTEVGRHFNPEVGFLTRSGGFRKPELLTLHRFRPRRFLRLQELRPHLSYRGFWNRDGFQETGYLHVDNHWEWQSGHEVHTGINFTREGVAAPFPIAGTDAIVPAGTYDHREAQLVAMTREAAAIRGEFRAIIGGFFGGERVGLEPSLRLRMGETFTTQLTWSRNDVTLPGGSFVTNLARARLSYSFGPRVFVQGLIQYNDSADIWSANLRFGWLQQANTGVFIVYNDTQYFDRVVMAPGATRLTTGRTITVKISRMLDLFR
jgi:hypothetical protein